MNSKNEVRRLGIMRTMRNIAMDTKFHEVLMNPENRFVSFMLVPLVGEEEITEEEQEGMLAIVKKKLKMRKPREPSLEVRKTLVETIALLSRHKPSRLILRSVKCYFILRELHKFEKQVGDEDMNQLMDEIMPFFILDEEEDAANIPKFEDMEEETTPGVRGACFSSFLLFYFSCFLSFLTLNMFLVVFSYLPLCMVLFSSLPL